MTETYNWYPKHKDGEPNLNPWWAVGYRRANQWCLRMYWKLRPRRYKELITEQAIVAHPAVLTDEARKRLGELLWILGDDTPYRYTQAQGERLNQFVLELLAEIEQERKDERR